LEFQQIDSHERRVAESNLDSDTFFQEIHFRARVANIIKHCRLPVPPLRDESIVEQLVERWARQFRQFRFAPEQNLVNLFLEREATIEDLLGETE
jgi:hypothetical protein